MFYKARGIQGFFFTFENVLIWFSLSSAAENILTPHPLQ